MSGCCPGCGRTDMAGITHVCPPLHSVAIDPRSHVCSPTYVAAGAIEPIAVIEFDERPALTHEVASEQLEHLYIHVGLLAEKLNEVIAALAAANEKA